MIFFIIVMLGCGMAGLVYLTIFCFRAVHGYQQKYWLKTYGRILDHEILSKWYHIYHINGKRWNVILKEYEYEVYGTYVEREEFEPMLENNARIMLNLMPIGSNVEVYYNPQNPGESTIEPGIKGWDYSHLLYGIVWMVVAGGLFFKIYF